jgi:hypothetical protein
MNMPIDTTERNDEEAIRHRAYMIWLAEGQPDDRAHDHWHQAVAESGQVAEQTDVPASETEEDRSTGKPARKTK